MKIRKIDAIKLRLKPHHKHIVDVMRLLNFKPSPEDSIFAKAEFQFEPKFKKVYVAGAMSGDNILNILNNISDGIHKGAELLQLGYAPFVPHCDVLFKLVKGKDYNVPIEYYYDYTMEYLKVADAVLVCDNYKQSKGTLKEIEIANRAGIPVFYSIKSLDDFFRGKIYV